MRPRSKRSSRARRTRSRGARAHAIVVGEETGWGVVPEYASGRVFRDVLGRVQQTLAARADRAYLVVSGFAIDLAVAGRRV